MQPGPPSNPLAPDGRQRLFYHRVGKAQSDDQLIYENPDHPEWRLHADVSEDGQYLVIALRTGTELHNRLYFIDLDNPKRPNLSAPLVKLFDAGDALYDFVANQGPVFYLRTSKGAPRNRLVAVDINTPDPNRWTPVIRETFDPLIDVRRVDDRFVAHRLHDAHSVLDLFALDGGVRGSVELPGVGTVVELNAHPEGREFYFTYTSFLQPPTIFRYDLDTRNVVPYKEPRTDDLPRAIRDDAALLHEQGRNARPDVHHRAARNDARRNAGGAVERYWKHGRIGDPGLLTGDRRVAGAGRHLRGCECSRRRRGRARVARGGHRAAQAGRDRRFHRCRRVPDQPALHAAGVARHHGAWLRRPAGRCGDDAAAGAVRRRRSSTQGFST